MSIVNVSAAGNVETGVVAAVCVTTTIGVVPLIKSLILTLPI